MSDLILVLNCGSSSIKFALFDASVQPLPRQPLWNGKVEGITGPAPTFGETGTVPGPVTLDSAQPYHAALVHIRTRVLARLGSHRIAAVAHRVVHGGAKYFDPVRVDAAVLADLKTYIPLAPLHQPHNLAGVRAFMRQFPQALQVGCFDTAFHRTMPALNRRLPLPDSVTALGVKRYGFHGLSYQFIAQNLLAITPRGQGKTIMAHLGSGASLCAMEGGRSLATTMGFSALDGLMMGTRCGALDPGAVLYLMEIEKLTLAQVGHVLYHESGLLGLSGVSSDPRVLLQQEAGNERVQAALALYVRRIVREIGAMTAVLGGLNMLVFTAGIGEHNAAIRERICRELAFLGVALDADANALNAPVISPAASRVQVAVEPTNEEWIAAWRTLALVGLPGQ